MSLLIVKNDKDGPLKTNTPGLVTVIIPVYCRATMLREAVASVLSQTYRNLQIVIVDDGSTDDTAAVIQELSSHYPGILTGLRQDNRGPGAARNCGLEHARGEFIQYLDSDDLLQPRKFELQVAALREHPDAGLAYGVTRRVNLVSGEQRVWARTDEAIDDIFPSFLMKRGWDTNAPLWRRSTCEAIGPWMEIRSLEDWEHDLRAGMLGIKCVHVPEVGAIVRDHDLDRASGMSSGFTSTILRDMVTAHYAVWSRMRDLGLRERSYLEEFSRKLFWLARLCGARGLEYEAEAALSMAREMRSGHRALVLSAYGGMATVLGWPTTVRWSERARALLKGGAHHDA